MSHTVGWRYQGEDGAPVTDADLKLVQVVDANTGYVFDADDSTWKASPTTIDHALTYDAATERYEVTYDESTWGSRTVKYEYFINKTTGTAGPMAGYEIRWFVAGSSATPVFVPTPAAGAHSIYAFVRDSDAGVPTAEPVARLEIVTGPDGMNVDSALQESDWDSVNGVVSWNVPDNTPLVKILIPSMGEYSYWAMVEDDVCINTATPVKRL